MTGVIPRDLNRRNSRADRIPVDAWVKRMFWGESGEVVLIIPTSYRAMALRTLGRMNINAATLFVDMIGVAQHINQKIFDPTY